MKPDPSIRRRWGAGPAGAAGGAAVSMSAGVAGPFVQDIEPRAVRAHNRLCLDVEEDARVTERAVAAIAGNGAVVDVDDLGCGGRAVRHAGWSLVGTAMIAGRDGISNLATDRRAIGRPEPI